MKYRYQCDDCFNDWISDHEEIICPVCGSTLVFLEESIDDEDDLMDEMLILMDEEDEEFYQ